MLGVAARTRMSRWMPRWPGLDWGQRAGQGSGLACVQRPASSVQRPASGSHTSCCRAIRDSQRQSRHRSAASSASRRRCCWFSPGFGAAESDAKRGEARPEPESGRSGPEPKSGSQSLQPKPQARRSAQRRCQGQGGVHGQCHCLASVCSC